VRQGRLVGVRRRHEADHPQRGLGQRAGLVGQHDVDRGQRLDRVELLGQHAPLGHLEGRDRGGEADQEDQALGDEVDEPGGQRLHARRRGVVAQEHRDQQADRQRHRDRHQPEQQAIRSPLERRARVTEGTRRGGELVRPAVGADRRRFEQRLPLDRERARPHRLTGSADDGLGFAGQVGLVEREPGGVHHDPVGHDLIAGPQLDEVADHYGAHRHLPA
jgi:hypothetical protein